MILPFANIEYYIIAILTFIVLLLVKLFFKKYISYNLILLVLSSTFIAFYYPKPIHIAIFVFYSYIIYYLFNNVFKLKNKLLGSIFILLPMILVKSGIKVHYYPFEVSTWMSFAGLSYISFRIISVYIEAKPTDKPVNVIKYLNFLLFTPTLLIGPIDRFKRFSNDLDNGYKNINLENSSKAIELIALGIAYKYIFAELISSYWLSEFLPESTNILDMAANMYGYYLYLFFDFAGYSSMAIGVGKFMGIDVPINFDKPFLARNPQDFWRRFHKTLGDWLKDYFFMPFYKFFTKQKKLKKVPLFRQNISLFATFLLMGLWNGFTKGFILSGMIFGIYSVVHNSYVYYSRKKKRDIVFNNMKEKYVKWISIFIMFNLVAFSIYIFSGRFPYLSPERIKTEQIDSIKVEQVDSTKIELINFENKENLWKDTVNFDLPQFSTVSSLPFSIKTDKHSKYILLAKIKLFEDDETVNPRLTIVAKYKDDSMDVKSIVLLKNGEFENYSLLLETNPEKKLVKIYGWVLDHSTIKGSKHSEVRNIRLVRE